ncbi:MAG: SGNH/GDSL hydrolase family protein, partial [Acidobacteria bacterium]|nr:SGNH/GDSL hydrolase family protein [Acidobacteriota bacterium]
CPAFSGKRVEILSFGVSGYGTAQELLMMRERVFKYSPDLVLLLVTTNNDITDNLREFKQSPIPYYTVGDGNQLQLDDSFRHERTFKVRNSWYSRLGVWLRNRIRFVQAYIELHRALKYRYDAWRERQEDAASQAAARRSETFEAGVDSQIYREPADDSWRKAWDVTERLFSEMKTEVTAHGAKFGVIIGSNGVQVLPDKTVREYFTKRLGVPDLYYPNRRIASFCKANDIPVLDLAPELREYVEKTGTALHGFEGDNVGYGHWNQTGHKVVGETIGRHLCDLIR